MSGGLLGLRGLGSGTALLVSDRSKATVTGGEISCSEIFCVAVKTDGRSQATIQDATVALGENEFDHFTRTLFESLGDSTLLLKNVQADGVQPDPPFRNFRSLRGVLAHEDSNVRLQAVNMTLRAHCDQNLVILEASGDSHLVIESGSYTTNSCSELDYGILARENSSVDVHGGQFFFTGLEPNARHIEVRDNATVTLFGEGFNYPMFEPISDVSGTITGVLSDGTSVEWDFLRDGSDANILLVPEPSSVVLLLLGIAGLRRITTAVSRSRGRSV